MQRLPLSIQSCWSLRTSFLPLRTMASVAATPAAPGAVPAGFKAVKERNATILLPEGNTTFLNPIQEYNRDLSVAVIKQFMVDSTAASKAKFEATAARRNRRKAHKGPKGAAE